MVTKEQLAHGLEYICGKTKVTMDFSRDSLDIYLYPNYPDQQYSIRLYLSIRDNRVVVTDLVGNGHGSDFQGQGYGTLIFNLGIQSLYAYYGIVSGYPLAKEIIISGNVSNSGDPLKEPAKSYCRDLRNGFWCSHGFTLKEPENFNTPMQARLADLKIKQGKLTENGTPRNLDLNEFWLKGHAPSLFKTDIEALMATKLEQYNLENLTVIKEQSKLLLQAAFSWSRIIKNVIWGTLASFFIYWSVLFLEPLNALSTSIFGVLITYLFALWIESKLWMLLPSYKKNQHLRKQISLTIVAIRADIEKLEQSHNGFYWRIHQGLKDLDDRLSGELFAKMAEDSKRLYSYNLVDQYDEYQRFIKISKNIVIKQNLYQLD